MSGKYIIAYLNDKLIYSPNFHDHVSNVKETTTSMWIPCKECLLPGLCNLPTRWYHGPLKGTGCKKLAPTSHHQSVTKIPGICNIYRKFICNGIVAHINSHQSLKRAPKNLKWNAVDEWAFKNLKMAFTTAPILQHPNPDLPFVIEVLSGYVIQLPFTLTSSPLQNVIMMCTTGNS